MSYWIRKQIGNGDLDALKRLLRDGNANVNLQDGQGWTLLRSASTNGHINVVRYLLEHGANVDLQNNYGETALMLASDFGNTAVVHCLVEHGANVHLQDNKGRTALMVAIEEGRTAIIPYLAERGKMKLDLRDKDGWTALMVASGEGDIDTVRCLAEHGANVDFQGKDGQTALMAASKHGHIAVVYYLVEGRNANVGLKDLAGWTALNWGCPDAVLYLRTITMQRTCAAKLLTHRTRSAFIGDYYTPGNEGANEAKIHFALLANKPI